MNSKLNLSDLQNLCNFIIYKIKSSNFANFLHENAQTKGKLADRTREIIKKNKVFQEENKFYQTVLSVRPLQIVTLYIIEMEKIKVDVYQCKYSLLISKEFQLFKLFKINSLSKIYFEKKMFLDLGKIIMQQIKNNLLVDISMEFMLKEIHF